MKIRVFRQILTNKMYNHYENNQYHRLCSSINAYRM